jgi:hypothetical protein
MVNKGNRFGLPRHIPENVKREVRRKCGFGCIICGSTIYEYEHVDPPFAIARTHDVDCITLLCPQHHRMVTNNFISKDKISDYLKNPAAKRTGFSKLNFPYFEGIPSVCLGGGLTLVDVPVILNLCGYEPLVFCTPLQSDEPTSIYGDFYSPDGSRVLKIVDNEWQVFSGRWDFECKGNRYMFKEFGSRPFLSMRIEAPYRIVIEKMKINTRFAEIEIMENCLIFGRQNEPVCLSDMTVSGFRAGISVEENGDFILGYNP